MDMPFRQTIQEMGYDAIRNEALAHLTAKHKRIKKIESSDMSEYTQSQFYAYQQMKEEIRVLAGMIQSFDDYIASLHELIEKQHEKLHQAGEVKGFLLKEILEEYESKPDPDAHACGRSKFTPEIDYTPGSVRSQIDYLLKTK